ncbi:hypothetical protein CDD82_4016 [Ophiocordyceps australis]|uniref:Uncharacterized protein n=1 Tax=Ophiocordyceps australis TaxID=1399860 RepID=A0A2C5ZUH4_9HYPO|nr:hypothetical protein CDD82_4016 [Ophiocordyceps australis]
MCRRKGLENSSSQPLQKIFVMRPSPDGKWLPSPSKPIGFCRGPDLGALEKAYLHRCAHVPVFHLSKRSPLEPPTANGKLGFPLVGLSLADDAPQVTAVPCPTLSSITAAPPATEHVEPILDIILDMTECSRIGSHPRPLLVASKII